MKKSFLFLIALCVFTMTFAQSSQLATLNHNGQISTYYGANALSSAHAAANNGDVITLSTGAFNSVNITKAVTIRGAGMGMDTINNTMPTVINSDFSISVAATDTANLILEGIYHNGTIRYTEATRPMFLKCRFKDFYPASWNNTITEATFMHCKFIGTSIRIKGSGTIINSLLHYDPEISNFAITNSIILEEDGMISNSTLYNCIIGVYGSPILSSNFAAYCIGFANGLQESYDGSDIFDNTPNATSNRVVSRASIFATYNFTINEDNYFEIPDDEWFTLSQVGKTYLGNDGTEVGIYGGNMPFDPRTTTPQITRCNVATKSTADGKLSVDIEVSGIE